MPGASARTPNGASSLSGPARSESEYDVAIVGAGVVGAAIARELARFELRLALVEAGPDVGAGTSKANTAILHTGFDAKPGTLEARLVARGHELLLAYARARSASRSSATGALLVAWNDEQLAALPAIRGERPRAAATTAWRERRRRRALPARAAPRPRAPSARSRCPTSTSSARSRRRSPSPPRPCSPGLRPAPLGARSPGWSGSRTAAGGCARPAASSRAALGGQRRRAALRRGRPHGRPRRLHGHAAARRADRVRQAQPAARAATSCCRCRPRRPRACSSRPTVFGNVMLGPTAEDVERKDDTGSTRRGHRPAAGRGPADHARAARAGGDRRLRRAARRHRARRLPARGRRAERATRARAASARPG